MKKNSLRLFAEITVAGILLLLNAASAVRLRLCRQEYEACREGTFTRSYESLISALASYRREPDRRLAPVLAFCFANLPLNAEEQSHAAAFCADIADETGRGEARAGEYCLTLLRFLSEERSACYRAGEEGKALGLPPYPEEETALPSAVMPTEPDDGGGAALRQKAEALLGGAGRLTDYSRCVGERTIIGFRTASSYAEFDADSGRLLRAVLHRTPTGIRSLREEEAQAAAERFLTDCGSSGMPCIGITPQNGIFLLRFGDGGCEAAVGITADGGEPCLFLLTSP